MVWCMILIDSFGNCLHLYSPVFTSLPWRFPNKGKKTDKNLCLRYFLKSSLSLLLIFFENIAKPYCKTSPKKTVPPVWKQRHGWLHFFKVMQPCWNALKRQLNALTAFLLNHAALFQSEVQPFLPGEIQQLLQDGWRWTDANKTSRK